MPGPIALVGGEGFTADFAPALRKLRELAGGDEARIVVLPSAAAEDGAGVPEQRARLALDFFVELGAPAEAAMVLDREAANQPQMVERIAAATWVHLGGGQPDVLRRILEGSAVWEGILETHRAGALLVGSSAGAVMLGEHAFAPRRPFPSRLEDVIFDLMPGFGLLSGIVVGPHFNAVPPELGDRLLAMLPSGATLVGIDEKTGLLGKDGNWQVIGVGRVTLVRDGSQEEYTSGEFVPLCD